MPQIAIYNVTVFENVGTVTIRLNRTGGDLSLRSVIRATSRDVTATGLLFMSYLITVVNSPHA